MSVAAPQQSLFQPFTIPTDSDGSGQVSLGAPPLGSNWQGIVTLSASISGQSLSVSISGSVVAYGSQQSGAISAGSGQTVTVAVTGAAASTTLNGLLQGTVYPGNLPQPPPVQPLGDVLTIQAGVVEISGTVTAEISGPVAISGGTIDVASGVINIGGGQGGDDSSVVIAAPQISLGSVTVEAGQSIGSLDAEPDQNCTALLLICRPIGQPYNLIVNGTNTGLNYLSTQIESEGGAPIAFAVPGADDNPIDVAIQATIGPLSDTTDVVDVYELTTAGFQQVGNTEFGPLFVQTVNDIPLQAIGTQGSGSASVQTTGTPPQNYYSGSPRSISSTGTTMFIAGVTGQTIRPYILAGQLSLASAAFVAIIKGTSSSTVVKQFETNPAAIWPPFNLEGWEGLSEGEGLEMSVTTAASAGSLTIDLTYDQY